AFKAEYQAPQSEEEAAICRGFVAVLAMDRIGRKDDFFTIGVDSIKAVRLQEFCQDLFLTSAQIFEGRTPAGIAALLDVQKADPYAGCDSPRDFYPLTDIQLGVFLECLQSPESVMYN
ncbi:phosphopantetheine-binding protein, partial [Eubacteriales bacterium DFI.9.88]|nr:phosphopantetheine-binding protein [Eubacteriales bacterium DFI.9.88]